MVSSQVSKGQNCWLSRGVKTPNEAGELRLLLGAEERHMPNKKGALCKSQWSTGSHCLSSLGPS